MSTVIVLGYKAINQFIDVFHLIHLSFTVIFHSVSSLVATSLTHPIQYDNKKLQLFFWKIVSCSIGMAPKVAGKRRTVWEYQRKIQSSQRMLLFSEVNQTFGKSLEFVDIIFNIFNFISNIFNFNITRFLYKECC